MTFVGKNSISTDYLTVRLYQEIRYSIADRKTRRRVKVGRTVRQEERHEAA